MANINYTDRLGRYKDLTDYYDPNNLAVVSGTHKKAVFEDQVSHNKITLTGTDLAYDGGAVTGTVNGLRFTNANNQAYVVVTDGRYDAAALMTAFQSGGIDAMLEKALAGRDKLTGSNIADDLYSGAGNDRINGDRGNDYMFGGTGNDRMTGGIGSDLFHFSYGTGKDVITDFDAIGGGQRQDHLSLHASESDFTIKQSGHDLVLNFGDGNTLTLLDVDRSDFSRAGDVIFF